MNEKCRFHEEREAVSKCEKCGNFICAECEHYDQPMRDRFKVNVCPVCSYEPLRPEKMKYDLIGFLPLFAILIAFIFVIVLLGVNLQNLFLFETNLTSFLFVILVLSFVGGIIIAVISMFHINIHLRGAIKDGAIKQEKFLESVGLDVDKYLAHSQGYCPECGQQLEKKDKFCSKCVTKNNTYYISKYIGPCPQCGNQLQENEKYCSECGTNKKEKKLVV